MFKIFTEHAVLNNFKNKKVKKHPVFKYPTNDWKYIYNSFKIVECRALILLKLIYPYGIINYIENNYNYSMYVPNIDLYIDYHEFISHSGPYNQYRSFNPANVEDKAFVEEVSKFSKIKRQRYWLSVDRFYTWAKSDYNKLMYTKFNRKKYKIFWSINEIEQCATEEMINASKQLSITLNDLQKLQNILYYKIDMMYNQKYNTKDKNYLANFLPI